LLTARQLVTPRKSLFKAFFRERSADRPAWHGYCFGDDVSRRPPACPAARG